MKSENILNALNDVDYDMIEAAEMKNNDHTKKLHIKKTILIAAAVVLLLCGTVSAAGFLWWYPNVHPKENGHTVTLDSGYIELPNEVIQSILEKSDPEQNNTCYLDFESISEWQDFFGLPFVASSLMTDDDKILIPNEKIRTHVTSDGEKLYSMFNFIEFARFENESSKKLWNGLLHIYAVLNENISENPDYNVSMKSPITEETIFESTTSSEIPYVIRKITIEDETTTFFLYYGYESVMYELWAFAHDPEQETMIMEDLKTIAETLQIIYPKE